MQENGGPYPPNLGAIQPVSNEREISVAYNGAPSKCPKRDAMQLDWFFVCWEQVVMLSRTRNVVRHGYRCNGEVCYEENVLRRDVNY